MYSSFEEMSCLSICCKAALDSRQSFAIGQLSLKTSARSYHRCRFGQLLAAWSDVLNVELAVGSLQVERLER